MDGRETAGARGSAPGSQVVTGPKPVRILVGAHAGADAVLLGPYSGDPTFHRVRVGHGEILLQPGEYELARTPIAEMDPFERAVALVFAEAENLLLTKHRDYGPANVAAAPGGALNGLRVRLHDKLARINHLVDKDADPQHEPLRDSFIDLLNYAAIGLLVLDGAWPGVEPRGKEIPCLSPS